MTAKEQLRQLVDGLSETEATAELKRWSARRDGAVESKGSARVDRAFTDDDEAALAESHDALASGGRRMSVDELHRLG